MGTLKSVWITICFTSILCLSGSCNKKDFLTEDGIVWNTTYHIIYESDKNLSDSIIKVFNDIDNSVSVFNEHSLVSKINKNATDSVNSHFIKVYNESLLMNDATEGMFDPTISPLITAWGFGKVHEATKDTLKLDSLLDIIGIKKTKLDKNRLYKQNPAIEFNFSAVAKGYGVDCIADMFERNGIENFMIEIGGEIRAKGRNSRNESWTIAVDKPVTNNDGPVREAMLTIRITDAGLATSGNYRNYHSSVNGGRYGHTISPVTGRPIKTDVISATVVAPKSMQADAAATACMVLGSKKASELCKKLDYGMMLILEDSTIVTNEKFNDLLSANEKIWGLGKEGRN